MCNIIYVIENKILFLRFRNKNFFKCKHKIKEKEILFFCRFIFVYLIFEKTRCRHQLSFVAVTTCKYKSRGAKNMSQITRRKKLRKIDDNTRAS